MTAGLKEDAQPFSYNRKEISPYTRLSRYLIPATLKRLPFTKIVLFLVLAWPALKFVNHFGFVRFSNEPAPGSRRLVSD